MNYFMWVINYFSKADYGFTQHFADFCGGCVRHFDERSDHVAPSDGCGTIQYRWYCAEIQDLFYESFGFNFIVTRLT